MSRAAVWLGASVFLASGVVEGQTGCVVPTVAHSSLGILPDTLYIDDENSNVASGKVTAAIGKWTSRCTGSGVLPGIERKGHVSLETWTVREDTYSAFQEPPRDPVTGRFKCGRIRRTITGNVIMIFKDRPSSCPPIEETIAHELGHLFRLGDANHIEACRAPTEPGEKPSIMSYSANRSVSTQTCEDVKRELDRTVKPPPPGGDGPDDGDPNPGPGDGGGPLGGPNCDLNPNDSRCPANCSVNRNHPDCDSCILNPNQPKCGNVTTSGCVWWPVPGLGWACIPMAPPPGGVPGDRSGMVTQTSVSASIDYRIHLDSPAMVTASLTGMSKDFDCRLAAGEPLGGTPPPAAVSGGESSENCTNRSGTTADTWSGLLPAGAHKLTVYPSGGVTGDYTLSVRSSPVRGLPFTVSETAVGGDRVFRFALKSKSKVKLSLTGMDRDMDCRVNGARCSNRGGTEDDSWNGTLEAGVHAVTVYPYGGGTGAYKLSVAGEGASTPPPAAPVLSGEVSGRKQALNWTAPASGSPLTRYQLQLRESQDWYFTSSGSPSPSSSIDPKVTSWSVTTRAGMVLRYRVRATNAGGDGAWSNVVELTSAAAARTLPFTVSETDVSGEQAYTFVLTSGTKVEVSVTGMSRDMDCRVGASDCTNRGGTLDDSWGGTLAAGTHTVTVYPYGGGSGSYTLKAAAAGGTTTSPPPPPPPAEPPAAPRLTGAVAGRTQTLSWQPPSSASAITRYQLETRASAAYSWRFTTAGSPSPSSSIGASARSWSVTTPAGLVRQYRLRATSSHGDGAWSNVVTLTTPAAPSPLPPVTPLSVPAIPNFRLPSAGVVNTVFPAASGGTPPYRYGLSGLPPGITFFPSTRRASGTLPTVRRNTTYRVTYTATDSAGASDSVTFTATVVPP